MLRIKRYNPTPLFYEEIEEARKRVIHWAARPEEERRQRRPPIEYDLFRIGHVVDAVVADFHGRCAYCERQVGATEGIGHFRPITIADETASEGPAGHYAWLAFEWLNLLLLCRRCQKAKGDNFPVAGGRRSHFLATFDEARVEEKPYLIDPTIDNPAIHVSYLMSGECVPKKNSEKSIATINILNLNDNHLVYERRKEIDETLQILISALNKGKTLPIDFLMEGPFLGARRDVLVRIIGEYRPVNISVNNGREIVRHINHIISGAVDEERHRFQGTVELMRTSDRIRAHEFERIGLPSQRIKLVSPNGSGGKGEFRSVKAEMRSLQIQNFRAIGDLQIPFPKMRERKSGAPCLLLLGENSVGKSTCLSAIALALLGTKQVRKLRLKHSELARSIDRDTWNVWNRSPVEVSLQFHDHFRPAEFYYDPLRNKIDGTEEQSTIVLGYGPHRYFANAKGRVGNVAADKVRSLFDPRRPLPDPSLWLQQLAGNQFDQVAQTIRTILPTGDDDQLVNDRRFGICVLAQGQLTPVVRLSEGYRSIFAMVADICRSLLEHWRNLEVAQGVVLIDEIETHLHPRWKMRVMSSLRVAFPSIQFVATTHDPLCVRGMDDGEVIVLTRDEIGDVSLVEDLPNIAGMRADQILTSDYFGLYSTLDPEIHIEIANIAASAATTTVRNIGAEAESLVSRLTIGDSAAAQIIQEALLRYLRAREQAIGSLGDGARADAVGAVFNALRLSRVG